MSENETVVKKQFLKFAGMQTCPSCENRYRLCGILEGKQYRRTKARWQAG